MENHFQSLAYSGKRHHGRVCRLNSKNWDPNRKLTWSHNVSLHVCDISFFILVKNNTYTVLIKVEYLPSGAFLTKSACCLAKVLSTLGLRLFICTRVKKLTKHLPYLFLNKNYLSEIKINSSIPKYSEDDTAFDNFIFDGSSFPIKFVPFLIVIRFLWFDIVHFFYWSFTICHLINVSQLL